MPKARTIFILHLTIYHPIKDGKFVDEYKDMILSAHKSRKTAEKEQSRWERMPGGFGGNHFTIAQIYLRK